MDSRMIPVLWRERVYREGAEVAKGREGRVNRIILGKERGRNGSDLQNSEA